MTPSARIHRIPVGISSCLLGEPVRYDGGHKYDATIANHLSGLFIFRPFCPEVAIGLGVPREPIQLVRSNAGFKVQGVARPGLDVTEPLRQYGEQVAVDAADLCGYIFKARSPSCGLVQVESVDETGRVPQTNGIGAYADALTQARPDLPVIDEAALQKQVRRDDFIDQVFDYYRHQQQRT